MLVELLVLSFVLYLWNDRIKQNIHPHPLLRSHTYYGSCYKSHMTKKKKDRGVELQVLQNLHQVCAHIPSSISYI